MSRFVVPYLLYSIAALVCIFLQQEVFVHLQIFHAKPDLLLLLVVMSALKTDWKNGVAVGLLLGFWIDLMNAAYFGTNMVVYGLVGAAFGALGTRFPHRTYEGYFFTAVAGTLLSGLLMLATLNMLGMPIKAVPTIGGIILPMTFYNAILAFLGLPLVWFHRQNNRRKLGRIDLVGGGVIFVRGNEPIDMEKILARRKKHRQKRSFSMPFGKKKDGDHKQRSRGSSGLFGKKNSGQTRKEAASSNGGRDPREGRNRDDRNRPSGQNPKRDSRGSSSDRKPRSHPNRRPQKHSGRRSK
ncbi:MAG: rod shape-determining protein MreD [Firmicutes bacterium]|nr:rod shape-determining protein MreD [Bacillota bacterium]